LEDLGCLRLSAFYPDEKSSQGQMIQAIARVVLGIFMILCVYDFRSQSLSFQIRSVVRGTLGLLVCCLGLSVLLKSYSKSSYPPKEVSLSPIAKQSKEEDLVFCENETPALDHQIKEKETFPRRDVRRNLLPEFEQLDRL
jgi:hypothetical protein